MQILGLLGMYFDAVAVEADKYLLFFRLALAILWTAIGSQVKVDTKLSTFLGLICATYKRPSLQVINS